MIRTKTRLVVRCVGPACARQVAAQSTCSCFPCCSKYLVRSRSYARRDRSSSDADSHHRTTGITARPSPSGTQGCQRIQARRTFARRDLLNYSSWVTIISLSGSGVTTHSGRNSFASNNIRSTLSPWQSIPKR